MTNGQPASTRALFAILSALVEERSGLHHGPAEQEVFLQKVGTRAEEAGFDSLLDYYYFLKYDTGASGELERLIDSLVVNETYFFRELATLRVLVDHFVAPLVRAGQRPRIWSAACATGEEPLTLAMLLAEARMLDDVEILASDISERALARARSGRFGRRSLREAPDARLAARWIREEGDALVVPARLRDAITWKRLNLCDPASLATVAPVDFILCRNVLIYFSDETTVRIIGALHDVLKPRGVLFVGVAESLLRFGTSLTCEEAHEVFLYRKAS